MNLAGLGQVWHGLIAVQPLPPAWVVAVTGLLALAAVLPRRIWLVSRNLVTMAHEGGHALVALATGRRLDGVRLLRSTAGVTVSAGKPYGPGLVLTTAAGYTAPPLLGLGAAALLAAGRPIAVLVAFGILLAALTIWMRNGYGLVAVLAAAAAVVAVWWLAAPIAQSAFAYTVTWFLLFGAVRPVLELQRTRRRRSGRATDADDLARLTGVPGFAWVTLFAAVALGALALGASWLIHWPVGHSS